LGVHAVSGLNFLQRKDLRVFSRTTSAGISKRSTRFGPVSFIDALRWLRRAEAGEEMPELVVNPWRPGRFEPRCKKRRPKQFDLIRVPRAELRKRLREKDLAA
jgi:hypothetical protein